MFSKSTLNHFNNIGQILGKIGERVEGNLYCDITPNNLVFEKNTGKIKNLSYLAKDKKKICEIGINAGHSLFIMLEQSPEAEYFLFDLGLHSYTKPCIDYIIEQFPNTNFHLNFGDSKVTLKEFIKSQPEKIGQFDLIHIDGGHEQTEFSSDFYMTSLLAKKNSTLIFDDYNIEGIANFLDERIKKSIISKITSDKIEETNRQLIYKFNF